jgi:hypothetical protein
LATLCFSGIAHEYKVDENAINHRLVFDKAALDLLQELILMLVLRLGAKDALDAGINDAD